MKQWCDLLNEDKWWDDSPMLRLYHGTSDAILNNAIENGIVPPNNLYQSALDILEHYIPRQQWTASLLDEVKRASHHFGMGKKEDSSVIFCMTDFDGPAGYARAVCEHGGEMAKRIYRITCYHLMYLKDRNVQWLTYDEFEHLPKPIKPRFYGAKPIVLELLVPKDWCIFYQDLGATKERVLRARENPKTSAHYDGTLDDVLDEIFDGIEIKIDRTIPFKNVVNVHTLT